MMLLDLIDRLNTFYGEVGNKDVRFTGLHNTYSPEPIFITARKPSKDGQELADIEPHFVLMGHPINSWPIPEMKVVADPKVAY